MHGRVLDGAHNLHALHDLAEHHVLAVQPLARISRDEELAAVRVRTTVRHGHEPCAVVTQREGLVLEGLLAIYGQRARAIALDEISALNHEALDHAVQLTVFVTDRLVVHSGEGLVCGEGDRARYLLVFARAELSVIKHC